jgi:hypothetical protein
MAETTPGDKRWWIAINGASCEVCDVPLARPVTRPRAEQLIGFPTSEEATKAQKFCLTAPMEEVERYFSGLRARLDAGEVRVISHSNPDAPTKGKTMWLEAGEEAPEGARLLVDPLLESTALPPHTTVIVRDASVIEVDKPLPPEMATGIPHNAGQVRIAIDGIWHFLFVPRPTREEIDGVGTGRVQVRMVAERHTLMLLFKYGGLPWQEGFFNAHRLHPDDRVFPPDPGEGMGWLLRTVLVDCGTTVVRSMRALALSRKFSVNVLRAIEAQLALERDEAQHQREIKRMQSRPMDSLAGSAHIRFVQGETAN